MRRKAYQSDMMFQYSIPHKIGHAIERELNSTNSRKDGHKRYTHNANPRNTHGNREYTCLLLYECVGARVFVRARVCACACVYACVLVRTCCNTGNGSPNLKNKASNIPVQTSDRHNKIGVLVMSKCHHKNLSTVLQCRILLKECICSSEWIDHEEKCQDKN